ncbi:hypothetical protein QYE76_041938 [Lolium multiflorum]|uniref:Uncharacterized protein n=1 Tax=Lolium multiflorum TaxID=4521 RepID=A0AAD8WUG0_LOLMU|nr:hypothetical protein QYE76_041938 [Lolium multiflorum]
MVGTEVAAVFLKRRIQPAMARVHPMWLYSGPKDETKINAAELSEKELLDEVRRLTFVSQEDSIPLTSTYTPLDADHPPPEVPIVSGNLHDSPNDTSEGRGSSVPVDFHTVEHTGPESDVDPIDSETVHTDLPPPADDACNTEGSMRDDDADHDAFVNAAVEETKASPAKRSIGGFADEDDLLDAIFRPLISHIPFITFNDHFPFCRDEGFVEPPSKKAKSDTAPPAAAASEASAPQAAPAAQASTASSLSKGKDVPAATMAPPFEEVKSSSSKLDGAIKKAAMACQEVDSLKEELGKLKERLKEEEARAAEKDELLRQSSLALLEAANIPAAALDKVPNNSPANGVSMALASHQLTRELLEKGKGALARMHLMIFPKIKQDKTLGQLIDAFAVDTKEVIEVFKRTSRTYGALLAFQLMMGHGFKANIEEMTKELPKEQDGQFVFPVPSFVDDSSGALPEGDRIQRMKDRITQMEKDLRSTYALAAIVNKKSEIAADVERYALTELHKATESLNFPPTLLTLMSEFRNAKKIRDLVRAQVFAGARFTLALVLARYPSASLLSIANATGDLEVLYPKVLLPANIIVDRLEKDSKVPEERETPQG